LLVVAEAEAQLSEVAAEPEDLEKDKIFQVLILKLLKEPRQV
jgi:hypothetical protein